MISFRPMFRTVFMLTLMVETDGALLAAQSGSFRTITLYDPSSISEAVSVNSAINAMINAAASCRGRRLGDVLSCACRSTGDRQRLQTVYHETVARHPEWDQPNVIISYRNAANGHWISLNFAALDQMLSRCDKE